MFSFSCAGMMVRRFVQAVPRLALVALCLVALTGRSADAGTVSMTASDGTDGNLSFS